MTTGEIWFLQSLDFAGLKSPNTNLNGETRINYYILGQIFNKGIDIKLALSCIIFIVDK